MRHAFAVNFREWLFCVKPSCYIRSLCTLALTIPIVRLNHPTRWKWGSLSISCDGCIDWGKSIFCELYLVPPKNWLRLSVFPYQKVIVFTFVFGSWNCCNLLIYMGISLILLPFFLKTEKWLWIGCDFYPEMGVNPLLKRSFSISKPIIFPNYKQ